MLTIEEAKKLKVVQLKEELGKRELSQKGKKAELQKRLIQFLESEKTTRKRRRKEKDDQSPPPKRAKKEKTEKYLSDDEDDKMKVEKTNEGNEEQESDQKKSKKPIKKHEVKMKKEPTREGEKIEKSRKPVKKEKTKEEPVATHADERAFSGAEDEFSGAEMSDDEDWRAQFRSGSKSPPPPDALTRTKNKLRSRWGGEPTAAKPILPQLPTKEQLANLSIEAMQNRIASELSALTRNAMDPSQFMKTVGKDFKEVAEPVLERSDGAEIDPHLYDPRVGGGPESRRNRKRGKALRFFKQGSLVQKANRIAQLLERQYIHATPSAAAAAELDDDVNYLSGDEMPECEWWDKPYTGTKGYTATDDDLKYELITHYIHNPAALGDLSQDQSNAQLPLYLTRKEKDKIRRKKSKDKHDQMIDEIRLGIREPPEPKLKVSNIVRVLGSKFIQDPSAAEAKARTQEALRLMKHQLHNENRKLTKSQRSEKKRKKLLEDTSRVVHTAVFRVNDLSDSKIRWKIKTNAKQYNLTGCMMLFKHMNMVMVEGGPKGIAKYCALMNRRIQWAITEVSNKPCVQVWQGITGGHVFRDFIIETFQEEADVIKYLDQKKVLGYWKQCKNFVQHVTY